MQITAMASIGCILDYQGTALPEIAALATARRLIVGV
jgi:hypothetical protein